MTLRKLSCMVLAICLALTLNGCGLTQEAVETMAPVMVDREPVPQHMVSTEETDNLVVWIVDMQLRQVIEPFQKLYPEINISVIPAEAAQGVNMLTLLKSLADGTGKYEYPDLIFVSNYMQIFDWERQNADAFADTYKLMDSGALVDLNQFIEQDTGFDLNLYEEKAVKACAYRGGQYLFPLSYGSGERTLLADEEMLEKTGLDMEACTDSLSFLKELTKKRSAAREQGVQDMFAYEWSYVVGKRETLFHGCAPNLIDYESGTVLPEEGKFREFCEQWKAFVYGDGGESARMMGEYDEAVQELTEQNVLFLLEETFKFGFSTIKELCGLKGEVEPVVAQFPNLRGGSTGEILNAVGICARGKNQQNAWKFLKFLLSQGVQGDQYREPKKSPVLAGMPVLLSAQDSALKSNEEYAYYSAQKYFGRAETLSSVELEKLKRVSTEFTEIRISSSEVYALFEENMEPYFKGKEEYEACVENLKEALIEYLES